MKRLILLSLLSFLLVNNTMAGDTTSANVYDWMYARAYNQLKATLLSNESKDKVKGRSRFVINLDFKGYKEGQMPELTDPACPDAINIKQIKINGGAICLFDEYEIKHTYTESYTEIEEKVAVELAREVVVKDEYDLESFENNLDDLNDDYDDMRTTYIILVDYVPIEFYKELPGLANISALITTGNYAKSPLTEEQKEYIKDAQLVMRGIINKAIADLQAQFPGVNNKMFYCFYNYHATTVLSSLEPSVMSYYQIINAPTPVKISGRDVSFHDVFTSKKNEYWVNNKFVSNPFPFRTYLTGVPNLLIETFKAYKNLVQFGQYANDFTKIDALYNCLRTYSVQHNEIIYKNVSSQGCIGDNNPQYAALFKSFDDLPSEAFAGFSAAQRLKILEILAAYKTLGIASVMAPAPIENTDLANGYEKTINALIKTFANTQDADILLNALKAVNPIYGRLTANSLLFDVWDKVEDRDEAVWSGGDNCRSTFMNVLASVIQLKSTLAADQTALNNVTGVEKEKRNFIWDYDFERIFKDYTRSRGVGTFRYSDVELAPNGKVSFKKEVIKDFAVSNASLLKLLIFPVWGAYEQIVDGNAVYDTPIDCVYPDPFTLIKFVNRSNLLLTVSETKKGQDVDSAAVVVPALYMIYANTKRNASNMQTNFKATLAIVAIAALPFTAGYSSTVLGTLLIAGDILGAVGGTVTLLNIFTGEKEGTFINSLDQALQKVVAVFGIAAVAQIGAGGLRLIRNFRNANSIDDAMEGAATFINKMESAEAKEIFEEILSHPNPDPQKLKAMRGLVQLKHELYHKFAYEFGPAWMDNIAASGVKHASFSRDFARNLEYAPNVILKQVQTATNNIKYEFRAVQTNAGAQAALLAEESANDILKIKNAVEEMPANTESITIVGHYRRNKNTKHISSKGYETREDILIARTKTGEVKVVEGNLEPSGVCTTCGTTTNCFTGNTLVSSPAGSKRIENINLGDEVFSYDLDRRQTLIGKVTQVFQRQVNRLVRIISGNDTIFTTPEHPFYGASGWMQAGSLLPGMAIKTQLMGMVMLTQVSFIDTTATVYNFEVDQYHTYYVGNEALLVHNNCSPIFDVVFNKIAATSGEANFATYFKTNFSGKITDFQNTIEGAVGAEKAAIRMTEVKRVLEQLDPAQVKRIFEDNNLLSLIKNDVKTLSKSYESLLTDGAGSTLMSFCVNARIKTFQNIADPIFDVSKFQIDDLVKLSLEKGSQQAKNAIRDIDNPFVVAMYTVNRNAQGGIHVAFNEARAAKLNALDPTEFSTVTRDLPVELVDDVRITEEGLIELANDANLRSFAKNPNTRPSFLQGKLHEKSYITALNNNTHPVPAVLNGKNFRRADQLLVKGSGKSINLDNAFLYTETVNGERYMRCVYNDCKLSGASPWTANQMDELLDVFAQNPTKQYIEFTVRSSEKQLRIKGILGFVNPRDKIRVYRTDVYKTVQATNVTPPFSTTNVNGLTGWR
jgi:Pretoxin HINT domain